jgi:pimeloyl-[acyl-carrier protein] methyl ester esterase
MRIHQEIYGVGDPIVLLHGWAMHTGIWRDFAQRLAENYQVICLDLPSHGRSEALPSFELPLISEQLIKAFPKEPCTVLGWSLGGTIALDLKQRFPTRIKGLILLASNPCFVKKENWAGMELKLLHRFTDNLMIDCQLTLLRFLSLQILGLPHYKTLVKTLKIALQETPVPEKSVLEQGLTILKETDLRAVVSESDYPLLLILGDRDTLVPVAVGKQMKTLQTNLVLQVLKKAGHVPFLSHQDELLVVLMNFMENKCVS